MESESDVLGKRKRENEEVWADMEEEPGYQISSKGSYRNSSSLYVLKTQIYKGVKTIKISKKIHSVARTVALYFIPNPENHPHIHYRDGDHMNCAVENLFWGPQTNKRPNGTANRGYHVLKRCVKTNTVVKEYESGAIAAKEHNMARKTMYCAVSSGRVLNGYVFEKQDTTIQGEEWRSCIEPELRLVYEVSSLSRVRRKDNGRILRTFCGNNEYDYIVLKKRHYQIHQLVCRAFHPETYKEDLTVNHIDGNKKNNLPNNLEFVTQKVNVQKASGRPVIQLSLSGEHLATYPSIREAARQCNGDRRNIKAVCKGRTKTSSGFFWKYVVDIPSEIKSIP